jgi:hypothetical protein
VSRIGLGGRGLRVICRCGSGVVKGRGHRGGCELALRRRDLGRGRRGLRDLARGVRPVDLAVAVDVLGGEVAGLAVGVVGDAEGEGAGAADGGDDAELVVREVLLPVDVAGGGLGEARGAGARVVRVDAAEDEVVDVAEAPELASHGRVMRQSDGSSFRYQGRSRPSLPQRGSTRVRVVVQR